MKKIIAVVSLICVVCVAGTALAQPKGLENLDRRNFQPQQQMQRDFQCRCECRRDFDRRNFDGKFDAKPPMRFSPNMPKEIKAKAVELAKLRIDLEAALSENPVNKTAALEAFEKIQKLEKEIELWKFEQKLNRMEEFKKQRELNRKMPPAPKAPAPAPEAPEKAE